MRKLRLLSMLFSEGRRRSFCVVAGARLCLARWSNELFFELFNSQLSIIISKPTPTRCARHGLLQRRRAAERDAIGRRYARIEQVQCLLLDDDVLLKFARFVRLGEVNSDTRSNVSIQLKYDECVF